MFCEKVLELIRELKRSLDGTLLPFNVSHLPIMQLFILGPWPWHPQQSVCLRGLILWLN